MLLKAVFDKKKTEKAPAVLEFTMIVLNPCPTFAVVVYTSYWTLKAEVGGF